MTLFAEEYLTAAAIIDRYTVTVYSNIRDGLTLVEYF